MKPRLLGLRVERANMHLLFFGCGVIAGVAAVAFAPGAPWSNAIEPFGARDYEALDLAAQRSMASAAWWMVAAAVAGAFVSLATLVLVANTLHQARRSADAAHASVAATLAVGKQQVRAYLTVEKANLEISKMAQYLTFSASVRNYGDSPARAVACQISVILIDTYTDHDGEYHEWPALKFETNELLADIGSSTVSIKANYYLPTSLIPIDQIRSIYMGDAKVKVRIFFMDVFGDEDETIAHFLGFVGSGDDLYDGIELKPTATAD